MTKEDFPQLNGSEKSLDNSDDEFLREEKIWEAVGGFKDSKFSEDIGNKWAEKYGDDPVIFFDEENLEELKSMASDKRLCFLARASAYLTVTPEMVGRYYAEFPDDLEAVKNIFVDNLGSPEDGLEHNLFSASALDIKRVDPEVADKYNQFNQYLEIAERREIAPDFILKGTELNYNKNFGEFGKAADGFGKALDEAGKLVMRGEYFINPEQIFTPEYEEMSEENKAKFLRKCINTLHFDLLFEEIFNSCFTAEMVENDKKRAKENIKEEYGSHNVAHSMIFKTYQPASIYNSDQERFNYEMKYTADRGGDIEEYPYHRILLAILDKLKNIESEQDKNTDTVVDFWNKNRNPIFGNEVAGVLSKQNPERAASQLLSLIREEKEDKNPLSSILYRLEFGKIGISEDGVRYLERIYDLEEYNNPDYHVSRLTADGEIGIFDEDLKLIKYFQLGDLSTEEDKVKAKVLDFVYETLFLKKQNEDPEETVKRLQYLEEFKSSYYKIANDKVFEKTGVRLNNLSFKEQGWFLIYYNGSSDEKKGQLHEFVTKYGEEGIKTFLSLEFGEEMGAAVLDIGEKLEQEPARLIYYKFNEIINQIKKDKNELENLFKNRKNITDEEIEKIAQNLLSKGVRVLVDFSDKIDNDNKIDKNDLLRELENYKADLILTASVYKSINKENVNFEDLEGVEFEKKSVNDLSDEEIDQMKDIYARNYAYNSKFQKAIINNFENILKKSENKTEIYFYKDNDKIVAFNRFDVTSEGRKYFGSFNVDPVLSSSSIGSSLMEASLEKEAENNEIEADCIPETLISSKYIGGGCGFIVKGIDSDYKNTGVALFNIERKEDNKKYHYFNHSDKKIIEEYNSKNSDNQYSSDSDRFILKFDPKSKELIDTTEKLIKENYIMSNYVFSKNCKEAYCCFEK